MKLLFFNLFIPISCFYIPHNLINPCISTGNIIASKCLVDVFKKSDLNVNTSRKLIHIISAPSFILTWNLYNDNSPELWASTVPILSSLYLIINKDNLSNIISRYNNSNEIFKGPLIYTLILSYITKNYWLNDPIGIIAMIQLSIGDGFSDIIGRKYGKTKWFYNNKKSLEGSLGFFLTSFLVSYLFNIHYNFVYSINDILIFSFFCSLIETLPYLDDNFTIPLITLFLNYILNI